MDLVATLGCEFILGTPQAKGGGAMGSTDSGLYPMFKDAQHILDQRRFMHM